jgi:UDP-glucose 4-epimerase
MKKVLVTGGLGFIGSNLVTRLHQLGNEVVAVDNMSSSRIDAHEFCEGKTGTEFVRACFADERMLDRVRKGEFDTVFHVGAIPRVGYSVEHPDVTTDINVAKTVKLMTACIGNVRRFVFSSSSSVYGDADVLPTPADYPKQPKSPYAWQKSCTEDAISLFCELYDLDAVSLRYFNVYGPGQFGDSAYSTAVSAWCDAIKHGTELRKDGSGEQSRDLCYVENVVDANILAMNSTSRFTGERYNVACEDRISNNEILEFLEERFGPLRIKEAPFRPGDVMHTQADISATVADLKYDPAVRFWEGLERTLEWWGLAR